MEELIFKRYCQQQNISAEDFEEYEDWETYEAQMKNTIHNILTMPIRDAAKYAVEEDWIWKHYSRVVDCIIDDVME